MESQCGLGTQVPVGELCNSLRACECIRVSSHRCLCEVTGQQPFHSVVCSVLTGSPLERVQERNGVGRKVPASSLGVCEAAWGNG